ncbi:hypothetical protein A8709_28005 [Paenibacillus pectinilyticus]|uniref:DUF3502 domain-containing protein n=1 Tax=Paenibacillus pectinilyticus TaxID=512399 RepID=A0A1C0ZUE1_9BACL|nr:ABC transporter substrate-binding protein [Paenibacillus pectinilyticus]OCT11721.1 hypothetical protein A8709_28005 [Paenibacillus pectinilyticus]
MKKMKKIANTIAVPCLVLSIALAGCGDKTATTTPAPTKEAAPSATPDSSKDLKPVELTYYFPNTPQKDLASVEDELNKLIKPKINATVHLKLVDWGTYDEKMNVLMASGEPYDLAFTSTWANNFYQNAAKGAFAPMDDLLAKYAPSLKGSVPDSFWKAVKVKGQTFGVPNFQQATAGYGYLIQKSVADKYKFDWKSVTKLSDLTPFLETVKKNEPNLVPFGISKKEDIFTNAPAMFGFEALGDAITPGAIYVNDASLKVVNQFETAEFKNFVTMMRDWYTKGYLRKDAASLKDMESDKKAGKNAMTWGQIDLDTAAFEKAGMESTGRMSNANKDVQSYDLQFVKPLLTTDKAASTITAISATSPNKERAMMFLNLLNTDKEVFNLINWGVADKHYKKVGDNRIETNKDGGYQIISPWEFGNMTNSFLSEGDPKGGEVDGKFIKMWSDLNKNAIPSNALGFVFDFTPVKAEKANCDAIIDELYYAISTGTVDPDKYLPQMLDKLKKAGADKIIAEKQKQLDAWKAANK